MKFEFLLLNATIVDVTTDGTTFCNDIESYTVRINLWDNVDEKDGRVFRTIHNQCIF